MKILKWLDEHLEQVLLVLLLSTIIVVMLMQIVFRYVLNNSLSWSEELCRYCFIWFMMIGFSYSIKLKSDLRIDAVVNMFPKKAQRLAGGLSSVISLIVVVYLFISSFGTVNGVLKTGERSTALGLHLGFVYSSMIMGFGLAMIRILQRLVGMIRENRNGGEGA